MSSWVWNNSPNYPSGNIFFEKNKYIIMLVSSLVRARAIWPLNPIERGLDWNSPKYYIDSMFSLASASFSKLETSKLHIDLILCHFCLELSLK